MNRALPTAEELEKLSLRAVVAYAARTVRRLISGLRDIVADEILDDALRLVDSVWRADCAGEVNIVSVVLGAERVAGAYADGPPIRKSHEKFLMVFSLTHAALAAMHTLLASAGPSSVRHHMKQAAREAERAVRAIEVLDHKAAIAMTEAARKDYEILLREYGEHDEVVIGNPVDCFGNE